MQLGHDESNETPSTFFDVSSRRAYPGDLPADPRWQEAYDLLRRLACAQLLCAPPNITLQATALAHEAWIRLARGRRVIDEARPLAALAATTIRSVLVDLARARSRQKRGGSAVRVPLDDVLDGYEERNGDLLALEEALTRFRDLDPRGAELVELRFFGGQSLPEAASLLGVSVATAERDWSAARVWLKRELEESD